MAKFSIEVESHTWITNSNESNDNLGTDFYISNSDDLVTSVIEIINFYKNKFYLPGGEDPAVHIEWKKEFGQTDKDTNDCIIFIQPHPTIQTKDGFRFASETELQMKELSISKTVYILKIYKLDKVKLNSEQIDILRKTFNKKSFID